ncbi:MAG: hypothetical protein GY799_16710 [Desulfobulbaceae bacterium]|nr:hypothetical protein [Desulfobulbaceae bacterium]
MNLPCVYFQFHNDLHMLLRKNQAGAVVTYALKRRASLKDIIESLGVPHTEVAQLLNKNRELGFDFIPVGGEEINVLPFSDVISAFTSTLLRPQLGITLKFMVDINVQKVARNLRVIGIDTTMVPEIRLVEIGKVAASQKRILVTRNRELLKCNTVIHGHLLRSENHVIQLQEVVKRYRLKAQIKPFTRCISCNGDLHAISKQTVFDRLEPLTQKYFNTFKLCSDCGKIFWQGSHHKQLRQLVDGVR